MFSLFYNNYDMKMEASIKIKDHYSDVLSIFILVNIRLFFVGVTSCGGLNIIHIFKAYRPDR